jgi:hypothetical protein
LRVMAIIQVVSDPFSSTKLPARSQIRRHLMEILTGSVGYMQFKPRKPPLRTCVQYNQSNAAVGAIVSGDFAGYGVDAPLAARRSNCSRRDLRALQRIWERAGSFVEEKGSLTTWMIAMTRNRAIDYRRSVEGRLARQSTGLESLDLRAARRGEADVIERLDQLARLRDALTSLTEAQRRVIELV